MKPTFKHFIPNAGTLIVVALLFWAQAAGALPGKMSAELLVPSQAIMSYQGTLTDPNGNPINDIVEMRLALYDSLSGGNLKWGPETHTVEVTDGLFHVLLGSGESPLDWATLTGNLYLDINVNKEQLSPREQVTSMVYAIEARTLSAWAETRGPLTVKGGLRIQAPDDGIYELGLIRTDENGREHRWRIWHMNQQYGKNSLQIWEYRRDSNGKDCGGNVADGAICDPRFTIATGGNVGIGTTTPTEGKVQIETGGVPLAFRETDQTGAGSLWRTALDARALRFDASQNGTDFVNYKTPMTFHADGSVTCGALTEANLQTPEELAAGRIDRFEEGDVLCWTPQSQRLEECATPNDPLIQAVADKSGRPIVLGAEIIRVTGPVRAGAYLVASSVPGYAMASHDPAFGTVIAQALEDFDGKQGIIKAMIRKM